MATDEIRLPALQEAIDSAIDRPYYTKTDELKARNELHLVLEVLRAAEEQCRSVASFDLRDALAALRSVR